MKRWWVGPLALVLVIAWWRWRVEVPIISTNLELLNYDLYSYYYPTVHFAFEAVRSGHLPLWNPYQMAGTPFFANQQHGLLYPPNVVYFLLSPAAAFKCSAILHYTFAFLGTVYLGRTLGLAGPASLVAALIFTFGGYLPGLLYLRTWLNGAVWLPLEFALAVRLFRSSSPLRSAALLAVAMACQYLGGYPLYCLLTGYCLGLFALWQSLVLLRRRDWRSLVRGHLVLALTLGYAAALSAVQLLPMMEMTALSPRKLGALSPLAIPAVLGLEPLRTLFVPLTQPGGRVSAYLGAAIIPLVVASLFHQRLRGMASFFVALAAVAAMIAAGPATPLYSWYLHLPTSTWFRFPGEFVYLTIFGLALAAGIGADVLTTGPQRQRLTRFAGPAVCVGTAALFIRMHGLPAPFSWAGRTTSVILLAPCLLVLLLAARTHRVAWVALCAALWLDLSVSFANYYVIPDVDPNRFEPPADVLRFLSQHQDQHRTYLHVPPLQAPVAKMGMMHRLYVVADHESLVPLRYAEYAAWLENRGAPVVIRPSQGGVFLDVRHQQRRLLDLLGTNLLVSFGNPPFADDTEAVEHPEVFAANGARVYMNPHALPRAFVTGRADVADPRTILARLSDASFDPLQTALVEVPAATVTGGVSRGADIIAYAPEEVTIHSSGSTPGLLVLTDQFYPGWQAEVDGKPAPIYCADYTFRGVPISAGDHTVIFRYRPRMLTFGFWLSMLAVAVAPGVALTAWLRQRRRLSHQSLQGRP